LDEIYSGGQKKATSMSPTVDNFNLFSLKVFNYSLCSKSCKREYAHIIALMKIISIIMQLSKTPSKWRSSKQLIQILLPKKAL
jgi:hypothetical protein